MKNLNDYSKVTFTRTEQWEVTAYSEKYKMSGKGTSEQGAELDLLRKIVMIKLGGA